MTGIVFDIARGSTHDGPGIRTTVFLKGCPLACAWCHNPESQKIAPEPSRNSETGETTVIGRSMSVEEVMAVVRRDRAYYRNSGGGLTVSGGEPTMQMRFLRQLLVRSHDEGFSNALETCGYTGRSELLSLVPLVDLWLYDYKTSDSATHGRYTGAPNHRILANLRELDAAGATVILRCPIIPGVNDTAAHFDAIASISRKHSAAISEVEIMPYTDLGNAKNRNLGKKGCFQARVPSASEVQEWIAALRERGIGTCRTSLRN